MAPIVSPSVDVVAISAKVLANQPLAVLAEDYNGIVKIVNPAFCKLFEISAPPESLIGIDCAKLRTEARKLLKNDTGFSEQIAGVMKGLQPVAGMEFELKDGRFLGVDYTPCFEEGNLLGHIWCYTDISARVKSARQLAEQKFFFENILNSIPAEIVVLDTDNKYLFLNKIAFDNPSMRSSMIGKNDTEYCRLKNKTHMQGLRFDKFKEAMQYGKESEWEDVTIGKKGENDYTLQRLSPNRDENGAIVSVTGYGVNISQLKKKEEELVVSEYKFRKLLDQLNEVVFRLTHDKNLEFLNPAWTKILGYSTDECISQKIAQFVIPPDREIFSQTIEELISRKISSVNRVFGFRAKDGRIKWMRAFMAKTEKFVHLALWGTLTDVTEQQVAEQELLKTLQREKELNELKSSFVQMVSHEFRTPLAGILSSVELLELTEAQVNQSIQRKPGYFYEIIKSQVRRMTELMNNVLLLGRIEAGKIELNLSEAHLPDLCKEIIQNCFHYTRRIIHVNTEGDVQKMLLDTGLIKHVITNLLSNALKYSHKEKDAELTLSFGNEAVIIKIKDYGIGIPKKELGRLFNSFFRASNTASIEGTGLGLVVVKHFVELHNGTIEVKSRLGKGSEFTVTLPILNNKR